MGNPGAGLPGSAPSSDVFVKSGGGGGGGSRAGQRAREDAKRRQEEKEWDDAKSATSQSSSEPEPTATAKKKPRLARLRFLGEDHAVGDKVGVACDTLDGATPEGVKFLVLAKDSKGQWVEGDWVTGTKATQGSEGDVLLNKPYDQGDNTPITFKVKASHQGADPIESDPITAKPEEEFEGMLFFSLQRQEYLLLQSQDEAKPYLDKIEAVQQLIELRQQAWQTQEPAKRESLLKEAADKTELALDGKTMADPNKAFEDLIKVNGKADWGTTREWCYLPAEYSKKGREKNPALWVKKKDGKVVAILEKIRKSEIKGRNAKSQSAKKQDAKNQKRAKSIEDSDESEGDKAKDGKPNKPIWNGSLKTSLFAEEIKPGKPWEWVGHSSKKDFREKDGESKEAAQKRNDPKTKQFSATGEAAFIRMMAGWTGPELEVDPLKRKASIGMSGQASFAIAEGKVETSFCWPSEQGYNLLSCLPEVKNQESFLKQGRSAYIRLKGNCDTSYFMGVSVKAALTFPDIDFSKQANGKRKNDVGASAEVGAMVGGQVKNEGGIAVEWSPKEPRDFSPLGKAGYEGSVISGAAAKASFKIGYIEGRFQFGVSVGLAKGFGFSGGWSVELGLEPAVQLIGHLLRTVNYHFVADISIEAFSVYTSYCVAQMTKGVEETRKDFQKAMKDLSDVKQWVARVTVNDVNAIKANVHKFFGMMNYMGNSNPESLGAVLNVIMKTREETDFERILWVLQNAESEHKLRWIVREVSQIDVGKDTDPEYEMKKAKALKRGRQMLMDFGEGVGFEKAKKKDPFCDKLVEIFARNKI